MVEMDRRGFLRCRRKEGVGRGEYSGTQTRYEVIVRLYLAKESDLMSLWLC